MFVTFSAKAAPIIPPNVTCDVLTGIPKIEATKMAKADPFLEENAFIESKLVSFLPIVVIVLSPKKVIPTAKEAAPIANYHVVTVTFLVISPS